jgi:hypothetical protein
MTKIAPCRKPLRVLGSLQLANGALGTIEREEQDKARKVCAVGWEKEDSNFSHARNIASYRMHLAMFGNALSPLDFRHAMSAR